MTLKVYSFIQQVFVMYLLCAYYLPGTILDARDVAVKKQTQIKFSAFMEISFWWSKRTASNINKQTIVY